ncbi:hypothetical protein [Salsipaludibacter albus]|uniref:hypothetical protein n=1 Tax=Salsipaludibacter albus TaxID=2849650 RepID=UPI001EE3C0FB|nr:hypothetical protein [Salsipaludibacter albus]MBY5162282.1 hypothetical protein [Salsipaludibacter albus]
MTWFATLGEVDVEATRVDRYLLDEGHPDRNAKVRNGTTCEVKVRTRCEPMLVAGGSGWVERWNKRSVPWPSALGDGATLVEVVKHRRLVTIDGCQVELTEAAIADETWHSLALEGDDNPPGSTALEPVVARLAKAGLGRFMHLTADRSHGYAQHLLTMFDAGESRTVTSASTQFRPSRPIHSPTSDDSDDVG